MNTLIENLQIEKRTLLDNINNENHKEILIKARRIDADIKEQQKFLLLSNVNRKQDRLRKLALLVWECEQPLTDITNNDGSFHGVKLKKYPKIYALKFSSALWKNEKIMEFRLDGEKFYMFKTKYEYGKLDVHTRPETFEAFLELNKIMRKELTMVQFNEAIEANDVINANLKLAIDAASEQRNNIKISSLNYFGLFGQRTEHVYTYSPNL
jgi:hypothetical protein